MSDVFCLSDIFHSLARGFLNNTLEIDIRCMFNFFDTAKNFFENGIINPNNKCGIYCLNNYFKDCSNKAVTISNYKIYLVIVKKESTFISKYDDGEYKYIAWVEDEEGKYLFGGLD